MNVRQPGRGCRTVRGFTLIEALVAVVVLAVGMLGIAGLYVVTLRSGQGSIVRTQAINLAGDIADRIRANRSAGAAYDSGGIAVGADKGCIGAGAVNCSATDLAATDLFYWAASIQNTVPGGTGSVAVAGVAAPLTYQITVSWVEQGGGVQSYVLNVQI